MTRLKLFGRIRRKNKTAKSTPKALRITTLVLSVLLALECIYLIFAYSAIPFIANLRHMAIETSLSTMRHQWVAYALFPDDIVNGVKQTIEDAREAQMGIDSTWEEPPAPIPDDPDATTRQAFFELFYELDEISVSKYLNKHPSALQNGWDNLYINESALDQEGTSMQTIFGDPVLAIDAKNTVLLIRVSDIGYRGVLAIAKDPSRLSIKPSQRIGFDGQLVGQIAEANNGLLAMTASGFEDVDELGVEGKSTGGVVAGMTRCSGETYGNPMGYGFKRVELRQDDLLYIVDSQDPISDDCTDAAEFTPALIIDGEVIVDENCGWNAINPRACIGQNDRGEIMMLCVEGRQLTSLGIGVVGCAEILSRYGCQQAMNLDGGTSAILWFDGQCVTRCSNEDLPDGRTLPNAFVYERAN